MFDGHFEKEGNLGCLRTALGGIVFGLLLAWASLTEPDWFAVGLGLLIAFIALILAWRITLDVDETSPSQSILVRLLAIGAGVLGIKTKENRDQ